MAGDFEYTIGVDIDSSGIDAFVQKMRGIASSVNFGSSFQLPQGATAVGPGVSGGGRTVGFTAPQQPAAFARALQTASLSALQAQRDAGGITGSEFTRAKAEIEAATHALEAGAKRFQQLMLSTPINGKGERVTESGLVLTEDQFREDAARQSRVAQAQALAAAEAKAASVQVSEEQKMATLSREHREIKERELEQLKKRLVLVAQGTEFDEQIARTKAQILVAEQQQARGERLQNRAVFREAAASGFFNQGTPTQRVQAYFKSRDGQLRDPLAELTGPRLLGQRAFQASSFAIGGLAFYGALQVIRDTLEETEKLEREFAVVRGQIERTFGDQSEQVFQQFRDNVRSISQETGQLGSEVLHVQRQLAAAFVDRGATPDVQAQQLDLAFRNTEQAFKFSEVTNLDTNEITDSLTAIGLSFTELGGDFSSVLDNAVFLEETFGVLGGEILTFTADLAPLAAQLGFTAEQLEEVGATAQKYSGRSGGTLAEQFGRIFTDLPTKANDLIGLFSQTPELADLASGLADAFVSENMEQVLEFILQAADRVQDQGLSPDLITKISETVAGRREGATFAAVLREPGELLASLQTVNNEAAGSTEERWEEVRKSLSETMERLRRAVEQFAEAVLSAGLADAFKLIAGGLTFLATAAGGFIRWADKINDFFGGLPGMIAGAIVALKAFSAIIKTTAELQLFGLLIGGGRAGAAAGTAAAAPNAFGRFAGSVGQVGLIATLAKGPAAIASAVAGIPAAVARAILPAVASASIGGVGGFTGAAAVGVGALAPAAAAYSVYEAQRAFRRERDAQQAREDYFAMQLRSTAPSGLLRGLAADDGQAPRLFQGVLGYGGIPGTQGAGSAILNYTAPQNQIRDQLITRYGAAGLSSALGAIPELTAEGEARRAEAMLEVDKALAGQEADLESVVEFIDEVVTERSEWADILGGALDEYEAVATAVEEASNGRSGPDLQLLIQAITQRRATPAQVRVALERAVAPFREIANAALRAGDETGFLAAMEQIAQYEQAAGAAISQYATAQIGFAEQLRGIFNETEPATGIDTALRILNDPNVTDRDTRLQALQQLQSARDQAFQQRLELARTERERLDIMAEGPGVDPIARAEAIYQQVAVNVETRLAELRSQQATDNAYLTENPEANTPGNVGNIIASFAAAGAEDIAALEGITQESISAIADQLVQDIQDYGAAAIETRLAILNGQKLQLQTALAQASMLGFVDTTAMSNQLRDIVNQIGTLEALQTAGVDPSQIFVPDGGLSETEEAQRQADERKYALDRQLAIINRARAGTGDPISQANLARQAAQASLNFARSEYGPDSIEAINAEGELAAARLQQRNAFQQLAEAQIRLAAVAANGDPVLEAAYAIQAARVNMANADGPLAYVNAQIQLAEAMQQQQAAYDDIAVAELELQGAQVARNPLAAAQNALQQADLAVSQAKGTAEQLRAEAQRISAQNELADAIRDIALSQVELLVALAEASGDSVEVARLGVQQALEALNFATSTGDEAAINRARGELALAQRGEADARLDRQRSDIDFALQMEQITTGQAIEAYKMLLQIPTNTEEQNREIQLAIKGLQDQLSSDFQFNLPTTLGLPTAYEVRRTGQSEQMGIGYNDNRIITVTVNGANADPQAIAAAVGEVVGQPNRYGTRMGRY